MGALIARIIQNPQTTLGGLLNGGVLAAAGEVILEQAGCNFGEVQWWTILSMLFAGPAVQGAVSTDNGKQVTP